MYIIEAYVQLGTVRLAMKARLNEGCMSEMLDYHNSPITQLWIDPYNFGKPCQSMPPIREAGFYGLLLYTSCVGANQLCICNLHLRIDLKMHIMRQGL